MVEGDGFFIPPLPPVARRRVWKLLNLKDLLFARCAKSAQECEKRGDGAGLRQGSGGFVLSDKVGVLDRRVGRGSAR